MPAVSPSNASDVTSAASADSCPLCVDLDGTLIASDVLYESLVVLARKNPAALLRLPRSLRRGRACFKRDLVALASPNPTALPYRAEVLEFLKEAKTAGRRLFLVTATDEQVARPISEHLGLFEGVIASDGITNCKGASRLKLIREQLGSGPFDYIGDSAADLPIFEQARHAYVIGASASVVRRARAIREPYRIFKPEHSVARAAIKVMRPHQWVKNLLLFLPLILAHRVRWEDSDRILATVLAFVSFCLCASSVYVLNDLLDIEADRQHRTKHRRPFASGALPLQYGPPMFLGLTAAAFLIAAVGVSARFTGMLALYALLTLAYSVYFKRKLLLDVMVLAGLYTLRIMAGAVAATVPLTPWLLAFSIFFFLSIAYAKRYAELLGLKANNQANAAGRSYTADDLSIIESVGPASGYAAVLVLALYINSDQVGRMYNRPFILWMLCPLLLYWITRLWFLAKRGLMHEDPVIFAIKDRVSWIAVACCAVVVAAATVDWFLKV